MPTISDALHRKLAFWGMAFIAMGLPLSVFLVSVGVFVLAGNWLLEGNFTPRLRRFFTDPLSLITVSIYFLFVVGMVHTDNWTQGLKELRIKLPVLLVPLFLFTSRLPDRKRLQDILMLFVLATVVGTAVSMIHFSGLTGEDIPDRRHLSVFISHIRFGLMIVLSFLILAYHLIAKRDTWSLTEKLLTGTVMVWLFFFLVLLESPSAYLAFAAVLGFTLLRLVITLSRTSLRIAMILLILLASVASVFYVKGIYDNHMLDLPFDHRTLDMYTANGRLYGHEKDVPHTENGHRVWNFVCWEELNNEWPKRSTLPLMGPDRKGNELRYTLVRYMSGKGLLKDSIGIHSLTQEDVQQIENGFTNHLYTGTWGVSRRIDRLFFEMNEYGRDGDPNASTLVQRLTYFNVGMDILMGDPLFGVGTGDIYDAYNEVYAKTDLGLEDGRQGISHNQYLSVAICLGVIGSIWFLFAFLYLLREYWRDYLYAVFVLAMALSFLSDNTLDSQAGATLFAFFNSFLMVRREFDSV